MTDVLWGLAGLMDAIGGRAISFAADLSDRLGLLAPAVAGAGAAVVVALVTAICFRGGNRSSRDVLRHGVAGVGPRRLLQIGNHHGEQADDRDGDHSPARPAVGFQIRQPKATALTSQARPSSISRPGLGSRLGSSLA